MASRLMPIQYSSYQCTCALDPSLSGINILEVELGADVPLVRRPLRYRPSGDVGYVVLEREPFDFVWRKGPRIKTDVLVTRLLRGMLIRIAPAELHRSVRTNARAAKVVVQHMRCDGNTIDVNL